MEELCYYLCNHLYLVDYTIMNESLCDWLEEDLEIPTLAENLRTILKENGTIEQFVMAVISYSEIYTAAEISRMQDVLEQLKNQRPLEKQKYKADNLLESGSVKSAIMTYLEIVHGEHDESLEGTFYGKVYGCLGAAYGRLFLYEEAAKMYLAAYQICEDESMLKAYLYACRRHMNGETYTKLLQKSVMYQELDVQLQHEIQQIEDSVKVLRYEDTLEQWKNQYRRISIGEI
jgi:hypothetical protein